MLRCSTGYGPTRTRICSTSFYRQHYLRPFLPILDNISLTVHCQPFRILSKHIHPIHNRVLLFLPIIRVWAIVTIVLCCNSSLNFFHHLSVLLSTFGPQIIHQNLFSIVFLTFNNRIYRNLNYTKTFAQYISAYIYRNMY